MQCMAARQVRINQQILAMQDPSNSRTPTIVEMAFEDGTPRKALLTALVVGTILTAINHGDYILHGQWPPGAKVFLTYCVPYCVTTWGAITGKLAQHKRDYGFDKANTTPPKSR
jgi:hypothetical protein